MPQDYDLTIIGGGILGAALAWRYSQRYPKHKLLLLEKEPQAALHQTGRNSGVIHAGVYYPTGSLKARYCRQGLTETIAFCREHDVPYAQPGKLIVATNLPEERRLESLFQRCLQNGLQPRWLDRAELTRRENNIAGQAAIHIRETGIVNYGQITRTMLGLAEQGGAEVHYRSEVTELAEHNGHIRVSVGGQHRTTRRLVNCAGLMTDRLASMIGLKPDFQIIPFRGEYFRLPKQLNNICRHLIYPVPDPALPFLGVHLTRMIDGSVTLGPNAVLAPGREAYSNWEADMQDCLQMAGFAGLWRLLGRYWRSGATEMKNSLCKRGYLRQIQKYCPSIELRHLRPYPSGIRAQAVDNKGNMLQDFHFLQSPRSLHVANAPSPAATSAIPIADAVLNRIDELTD